MSFGFQAFFGSGAGRQTLQFLEEIQGVGGIADGRPPRAAAPSDAARKKGLPPSNTAPGESTARF
jgi:hypothetical protein